MEGTPIPTSLIPGIKVGIVSGDLGSRSRFPFLRIVLFCVSLLVGIPRDYEHFKRLEKGSETTNDDRGRRKPRRGLLLAKATQVRTFSLFPSRLAAGW